MEKKLKILNLYAGIGGNRKLWPKTMGGAKVEVTAVELNQEIAKIYSDFFPEDKVIVGDAHEYLLNHYEEYDFIWSSPPCPTHGQLRYRMRFLNGQSPAVYPDMTLYQEIILLMHHFKGRWVVENTESYYEPLIRPQRAARHFFWADFSILDKDVRTSNIKWANLETLQDQLGFDLSGKKIDKKLALRNCVHPLVGLHILNCAFKTTQLQLPMVEQ